MPLTPEQARAELERRRAVRNGNAVESGTADQNAATQTRRNPGFAQAASAAYHPLLEVGLASGGALLGGGAGLATGPAAPAVSPTGAVIGSGLGYAAGREIANQIDYATGVKSRPNSLISQVTETGKDVVEGAAAEALGMGVPAVGRGVMKVAGGAMGKAGRGLAKMGQAVSGAKWYDIRDAFKSGFKTYGAPSVAKAGKLLDDAEETMQPLTPQQRVAIATNSSEAGTKAVAETMEKWMSGKPISPEEALFAKRAADSIFPNNAATPQGAELTKFKQAMDAVIGEAHPKVKEALGTYRQAKVKNNLLTPLPVNKSGEISKINMVVGGPLAGYGFGAGQPKIAAAILAQAFLRSPLVVGAAATTAGQLVKTANAAASNPTIRRGLIQQFITKRKDL